MRSRTRSSLTARLAGALAVGMALLATTGCQPQSHAASDAATAYLEAIAAGDAAAANALATPEGEYGPRPAGDSLDGAETITDPVVERIPDPEVGYGSIAVSYTLAGEQHEAELSMRLVDDEWLVTRGLEGPFIVRWTGFSDGIDLWSDLVELRIGSTPVAGLTAPGRLYPAVYPVVVDLAPYGELVTETVVALPAEPWSEVTLEVEVAPSEHLLAEVTEVLAADLAAVLERAGDGVPSLYPGENGRDMIEALLAAEDDGAVFAWTLAEPVEVTWQPDASVLVVGTAVIRAEWTGNTDGGELVVPLVTSVRAVPKQDGSLDVSTSLWHHAG